MSYDELACELEASKAREADLQADTGILKSENSKLHEELGQAYGLVNQADTRIKTLEDALIYLGRTAQRHHSRIIEQALAAKESGSVPIPSERIIDSILREMVPSGDLETCHWSRGNLQWFAHEAHKRLKAAKEPKA